MVCTVERLARIMDEIAPEKWAEPWDNVGLLLGDRQAKVERLMVVLDISPAVVEEAIRRRVDMIISHHPLIFKPIKGIVSDSIEGSLIISLLSHNIAVYCAHTNLDMADGGVDDSLANALGLRDVKKLNPVEGHSISKPNFGRWGRLDPPQSLQGFTNYVGKILDVSSIELIGVEDPDRLISSVALCAGSGAGFMFEAQKAGVDLFVSGEIKYHDALLASWSGITIMTVGHFYSEMPAVGKLIDRLQMITDSLQYKVEILKSGLQKDPYSRIIID